MIRRTLGQIRKEIARTLGTSGFNMADDRVISRINEATEELMSSEDWPGVVDRYLFTCVNGYITLPYFLDRIMGVAVNNIPYPMSSPWFEFVEYGPGPQHGCNWLDTVIDRDETPIQVPFPCGTSVSYSLYTKGSVDERVSGVRPTLLVRGRSTNHRNVRSFYGTSYIDGEQLPINGDSYPYTFYGTAIFEDITEVVKPETNGYVELWATNGTPSQDVLLAAYAPGETNPSYHSYYIPTWRECWCPGNDDTQQESCVLVRGRKRFIPVATDDDPLIISNFPALKSMCMAIQKREVSDIAGYAQYKAAALDILRHEATSYRGKARAPALTIAPGFGVGRMPYAR